MPRRVLGTLFYGVYIPYKNLTELLSGHPGGVIWG
jgi:hypothetical protein